MYKKLLITVAAAASLAACQHGMKGGTAGGTIAPGTPPTSNFLPPGTTVNARLDEALSMANHEGEGVNLTVADNVYAQDGSLAIPAGTMLQGRLTGVHNAKAAGEQNVVRVNFDDLVLRGQHYPFTGMVANVQANGVGVLNESDASKTVSKGMLGAGAGQVLSMGMGPTAGVMIPAGSVFTVRSSMGIQVH